MHGGNLCGVSCRKFLEPLVIATFGDSKTSGRFYLDPLESQLNAVGSGSSGQWQIATARDDLQYASGGVTSDYLGSSGALNSWLNARGYTPDFALIDIGINERNSPNAANFEANLAYAIDRIHARWPNCRILVMKIWARGYDSFADTYAASIDTVLSTRSSFASSPSGLDERIWLKGSDNGVTNADAIGLHPNVPIGYPLMAAAWKAAMGY